MIQGMRISAAGAQAQSLRHDVIANNLANVNTTGFRRQLAIIGADPTEPTATGAAALVATPAETGYGALLPTGRSLDLAIEGDAWFVVGAGSETCYTRAGQFDLDDDGYLVTADHQFRVRGVGSQDILLDRSLPFTVGEDGRVLQNGSEVAQLDLASFRDPDALVNAGGGRMKAPAGVTATGTHAGVVRQGYLEHSSVVAVRELVSMMEAYRAYEANVNMVQRQDSTLGRLIEQAGRT